MKPNLRKLHYSFKLHEPRRDYLVTLSIISICFFIFAFIVWAGLTDINEVSHAEGEIVPEGMVLNIQHFDGGMVKKIAVNEGQMVNKNQLLMILDGAGIQEELSKSKLKQLSLALQAERLKAFIENRRPNYSQYLLQYSDLVKKQLQIYQGMLDAKNSEKNILIDQLKQQKHALNILMTKINTLEKDIPIAEQMFKMLETLSIQGNESKMKLLAEQRKIIDLQGQYEETKKQIEQASDSIKEYENKLASFDAKNKEDAFKQLEALENEITLNGEQIEKLQAAYNRLNIRSPEKGIIKSLSVNTLGEVIAPGKTLMELVPINKPLIANIKIKPIDIGHIKAGQSVHVKISSYDFVRYGTIVGQLYYISATTFSDERGNTYYKGLVRLNKNYIGNNPVKNLVMPGMVVQADIITGEKSILAYLLKPIQQSVQNSMNER